MTVHHLPRNISDNSPLLLKFHASPPSRSAGFIFQSMWVDHPDFLLVVKHSWDRLVHGTPGLVFHLKLLLLKHTLKQWNWEVFGHVSIKKKELQEHIQTLEMLLQQGWNDSIHLDWENSRKHLRQVENWEDELFCQKARMAWTKDGDRITKF